MMRSEAEYVELFHFIFLERLLRLTDPSLYVLRGDVNLRFFEQSPRYSEDMDIDVHSNRVEVHTLKKNGYYAEWQGQVLEYLEADAVEMYSGEERFAKLQLTVIDLLGQRP